MAQSDPRAPRALFVLRGGEGTVPGPEAATVPLAQDAPASPGTPVPVPPAVVPMTVPERAILAGKHWAGIATSGAGQLWLHPGRVLYVLWHGKPESMAEHRAYVKSRAWVPKELRGHQSGRVITFLGIGYHLLIARPIKAAARTVDAAAERPLRLTMLAAFVTVFTVAVLPHIPLHI